MPVIQVIFLYLAVGGNPTGVKLAIVNNEVKSLNECSMLSQAGLNDSCQIPKASCRFIEMIDDTFAIKVFYKTFDEALASAKRGYVSGILLFEANFTEAVTEFEIDWTAKEISSSSGHVQIFLDQTDMILESFLMNRFYFLVKDFSEDLMVDCMRSRKLRNFPINLEEPIYGTFLGDQRTSKAPIFIVL